jgi:CPA1 family monovalent cation:H+ antiporter
MMKRFTKMDQFLQSETLILELLLIVSLVAIAVRRLHIPYTVALVVVGLVITLLHPSQISLTPELILTIFIPPLLFEAAFHLRLEDLRRNLLNIISLAVPGIILKTIIIGWMTTLGTSLSLPAAMLFGALISTTDPVAVISVMRALRVPRRLGVLIEGESLFNDGTAIVVFNLILVVSISGHLDLAEGILDFFRVSIGGTLVGLVLGWLTFMIISHVDDYLIETTFTTILAFGAYLIAERFQFSGVLAVVAAGLLNGNIGARRMSPTTRIVLDNFWEYMVFLANSLIFLLIGLQVNVQGLLNNWQSILWSVFAVLFARGVVVYGLGWAVNRWGEPIPWKWRHVLAWGGLRGAICLALALSLPVTLGPERDLILTMTFGVVLFTLLIQGTTMQPLMHWLNIIPTSDHRIDYEIERARLISMRSGMKRIMDLYRQGLFSGSVVEIYKSKMEEQMTSLSDSLRKKQLAEPDITVREWEIVKKEFLQAQRSALMGLRNRDEVSAEAIETIIAEIDNEMVSLDQQIVDSSVMPPQQTLSGPEVSSS